MTIRFLPSFGAVSPEKPEFPAEKTSMNGSATEAVSQLPAPPNVIDYAARLVRATRPQTPEAAPGVNQWIRWGASPRASLNLIVAGRARAACRGRFNVSCEDVVAIAPLVLRHRIIRSFQADAEGKTADDIVAQIIREVPQDV